MPQSVLLYDGVVYSPTDPFATAMLVVGDRVVWVGGEGAAHTHMDSADRVVALGGALVTPAFVDAHVHVLESGLADESVDLTGCTSVVECLDRVARRARSKPGEPIFGHGWDERGWPKRARRPWPNLTAQPALSWPISPGWTCIRPWCPPVWSPLCR